MKIKHKLISIPIICSILVFVVIILFSLYNYQKVILDEVNINQVQLVNSMSQTVDEYILKYQDTVTHIEELDVIKEFDEYDQVSVENRGLSDKEGVPLRNMLKSTIETYPRFVYIAVLSKIDAIMTVYEPYEEQLYITEEAFYRGFSYRDWYIGAMNNKGTYVSEAFISASINKPVVAIATPIYAGNENLGVVIGAIRLTDLSEKVESIRYGDSGITYIVDKNMHIVAHPDNKYFAENELYNIENSNIIKFMMEHDSRLSGSTKIYDDLTHTEVYVYFTQASESDWYIISQVSVKEVEQPLNDMIKNIMLFSLPLLLGYLVFLIFNTKSILASLTFLNMISNRVIKKNLNLSPEDHKSFSRLGHSSLEIKRLMDSYHLMIDDLKASFTMLEKSNKEINFLANHDPLTSLPNRRKFQEKLTDFLKGDEYGAVILMDIDNFKLVNDTLGHLYGDKILVAVATRLLTLSNDDVFATRFGGDEFILCIKNHKTKTEIEEYLFKIFRLFEKPVIIDSVNVEVNFSMGISQFPIDSKDQTQLIRFSDLALYGAKNSGKNHYEFFGIDMEENVFRKSDIESALKQALKNDGFELVYQPQVNLKTGEVDAYEALLRLKDNMYSPGEFIPISEETGQIIAIGRWVLEEAIKQLSHWKKENLPIKIVSVNFSAAQLYDSGFFDFFVELLDKYQVESRYIEIELTENVFVEKLTRISEFLYKLQNIGIEVSIDDFGTGYSSINYLISLPVHKIKLDRSLSEKFLAPDSQETIVTLVALAHSLDMIVVAEGIENKEDVNTLITADCDLIQGYYFSRPMKVEEVPNSLIKNYLFSSPDTEKS